MPNDTELPSSGFVRLPSIIGPKGPIPVSKSTWWAGVKDGRFPKPVKLGPRITAWWVDDIRALIDTAKAYHGQASAQVAPDQRASQLHCG